MKRPIIIGVGQVTHRQKIAGAHPSALDLAQEAIESAARDSGCPTILEQADRLSLVHIFSDPENQQARRLCSRMGISPAVCEDTAIGGNTPQWLVNRAADEMMRGECRIRVLAGAEAFYRQKKIGEMISIDSIEERISRLTTDSSIIGDTRDANTPYEQSYRLLLAHRIYPLFENALRVHLKMAPGQYRTFLRRYYDSMASAALGNPRAWSNKGPEQKDITAVSADNPIFNYPYTKYMNPNPSVNQAAAVIMTDTDTARRLSIPRDKWVYLHSGADAHDKWYFTERVNYHSSPAIRLIVQAALRQAGLQLADIGFFDLYSCFPCAALIAAQEIGLPVLDLPPLSITGGLSYFGGPGNNYTMHSIVAAVERLRNQPETFGLVSGLGWYLTKHSVGIYSGVEPKNEWCRTSQDDIQITINAMPGPALCMNPDGKGVVESYTVLHEVPDRPPFPVIVARLQSGERCLALAEPTPTLIQRMEEEEFIGCPVDIRTGGKGLTVFSIR